MGLDGGCASIQAPPIWPRLNVLVECRLCAPEFFPPQLKVIAMIRNISININNSDFLILWKKNQNISFEVNSFYLHWKQHILQTTSVSLSLKISSIAIGSLLISLATLWPHNTCFEASFLYLEWNLPITSLEMVTITIKTIWNNSNM